MDIASENTASTVNAWILLVWQYLSHFFLNIQWNSTVSTQCQTAIQTGLSQLVLWQEEMIANWPLWRKNQVCKISEKGSHDKFQLMTSSQIGNQWGYTRCNTFGDTTAISRRYFMRHDRPIWPSIVHRFFRVDKNNFGLSNTASSGAELSATSEKQELMLHVEKESLKSYCIFFGVATLSPWVSPRVSPAVSRQVQQVSNKSNRQGLCNKIYHSCSICGFSQWKLNRQYLRSSPSRSSKW